MLFCYHREVWGFKPASGSIFLQLLTYVRVHKTIRTWRYSYFYIAFFTNDNSNIILSLRGTPTFFPTFIHVLYLRDSVNVCDNCTSVLNFKISHYFIILFLNGDIYRQCIHQLNHCFLLNLFIYLKYLNCTHLLN